ncbi:MAG TPA: membrane protein insertase YidC [Candidatus Paceibacterota bacterium]
MFKTIFVAPLYNAFIFITSHVGNSAILGLIIITLIIKLILLYFTYKTTISQWYQKLLEPEVEAIKKNVLDTIEQNKQVFALYGRYNINPFSGCLPILIQLPIIIALYQIFYRGIDAYKELLYVPFDLTTISYTIAGLDFSHSVPLFAILAGVVQFLYGYLSQKRLDTIQKKVNQGIVKEVNPENPLDMSNILKKQMLYLAPAMIIGFGLYLPGAVAIYWIISTGFSMLQEAVMWRRWKRKHLA